MKKIDVLVVGCGPAGLTAAIYSSRSKLETVCIEKKVIGGQMAITDEIENYSGFPDGIDGASLATLMKGQAEKFGAEIVSADVMKLENDSGRFIVHTNQEAYSALTVILAPGAFPQALGCPGEEELRSKGVSYCATCDGAFFEGCNIAVVGGGDAAVEEAVYLTRFAEKVTIIHRRDQFRANKSAVEKALSIPKIEVCWNSTVSEIFGDGIVEGVKLKNTITGEETTMPVDGVFIFVGAKPNTAILKDYIDLDEKGYIITDEDMRTNIPGIFAAGDVRAKTHRQVCTAVSDGAIAALQAEKFILELK